MFDRDDLPPQVPGYQLEDLERLSATFEELAPRLSRPGWDLALPPHQANVLSHLLECHEAVARARMVMAHGRWIHLPDRMVNAILEAMDATQHQSFCQVEVTGSRRVWEAGHGLLFVRIESTADRLDEPLPDGRYVLLRPHLLERQAWEWGGWVTDGGGLDSSLNLEDRRRCERVPCFPTTLSPSRQAPLPDWVDTAPVWRTIAEAPTSTRTRLQPRLLAQLAAIHRHLAGEHRGDLELNCRAAPHPCTAQLNGRADVKATVVFMPMRDEAPQAASATSDASDSAGADS